MNFSSGVITLEPKYVYQNFHNFPFRKGKFLKISFNNLDINW